MSSSMKSKWFMLWILVWLGMTASAVAQDTLTVMTYNIYHAESATNYGNSTLKDIAQFIVAKNPDFVALQEVDSTTTRLAEINDGRFFGLADSLAKLTNMIGYFGKTIDFQGGGYGIAILSKKAGDVRKVKLPNPQNGEPRVLLTLQSKTNSGRSLVFANTHLDHKHEENRLAQVKAINASLSDNNMPVILSGDFNFESDSKGYNIMQESWLDASRLFSDKVQLALTYPSENPEKRIDYIWLSKNVGWEVLDYETPDVRFSDHLPVVAKVIINY